MGSPERPMWRPERFLGWFVRDQQWSRVGLPMAIVLLLLSPFLLPALALATFVVFLQLPVYMFHQYEEHGHGAFKAYLAQQLPRARGVNDRNIFVVNVPGVWGINLLALYAARYVGLARGLVGPYLTLINGVLHVIEAVRRRGYNPGLWTGVVLFLPIGGWSVVTVARDGQATRRDHTVGIGGAVLIHLLTILGILFAGDPSASTGHSPEAQHHPHES